MGPGTLNTTSFTAFRGAYMHFSFAIQGAEDDQSLAKELQAILAPHVTSFYSYPNLATDPNPGEPQYGAQSCSGLY